MAHKSKAADAASAGAAILWKDVDGRKTKRYGKALCRVLSKLWIHLPGPLHRRLFARLRTTRWAVAGPGSPSGQIAVKGHGGRMSSLVEVNIGFLGPQAAALEGILLHELVHLATLTEDGTPDLEISLSLFGGYLCQRPRRRPRRLKFRWEKNRIK